MNKIFDKERKSFPLSEILGEDYKEKWDIKQAEREEDRKRLRQERWNNLHPKIEDLKTKAYIVKEDSDAESMKSFIDALVHHIEALETRLHTIEIRNMPYGEGI